MCRTLKLNQFIVKDEMSHSFGPLLNYSEKKRKRKLQSIKRNQQLNITAKARKAHEKSFQGKNSPKAHQIF